MQNYTIRAVILPHKINKAGTMPVKICVTLNRQPSYFATPYRVILNQFDRDKGEVIKHPNAGLINTSLRQQIAQIERDLLTRDLSGLKTTVKTIRQGVPSFQVFAKEVRGDTRNTRKEIMRVYKYLNPGADIEYREEINLKLQLADIDVQFLRKFNDHEKKRGMSNNTRNSTFKFLRRVFNQAKTEGLIRINPFDEYDIPKYIQTDRVYMNEAERARFVELIDKPMIPELRATLIYALLGCHSGLRHQDWAKFNIDMVDKDLFNIRASKNKQLVVMLIGPTLGRIIELTKLVGRPYGLKTSNDHLKVLAVMAGINKRLSTHCMRHSFGYLCASLGIPKQVTAELMGISVAMVEVYYHLAGVDITKQASALKGV